jgi:hypothetical protein
VNENIVINILTRTSNRPVGFDNLRYTIINQTYKNVRHIVSYDNDADLEYLNNHDVQKVRVNYLNSEKSNHPEGFTPAHYNLYCNELLKNVTQGWIMFLDDDDCFLHNKVLEEIIHQVKKADNDTMFFWQMRYPDRKILPSNKVFQEQKIEIYNIGAPCFLFHSKYKNQVKWDGWKVSDYRFIKSLSEIIPKKIWLNQIYIQINNQGDLGNRNDIHQSGINKLIFYKTFFWHFIPKYHYQVYGLYVFKSDFFKMLFKKVKMSLWYRFKKLKSAK